MRGPIEAEWLPGNTQEGTGEADCIQKRGDALSICLRSTSWESEPRLGEAETSAEALAGREPQNESALFWHCGILKRKELMLGRERAKTGCFRDVLLMCVSSAQQLFFESLTRSLGGK